ICRGGLNVKRAHVFEPIPRILEIIATTRAIPEAESTPRQALQFGHDEVRAPYREQTHLGHERDLLTEGSWTAYHYRADANERPISFKAVRSFPRAFGPMPCRRKSEASGTRASCSR